MTRPLRIYVASSWRNEERQQAVVQLLRRLGHDVYDFRHPAEGVPGFSWSDVSPQWESWTPEQQIEALTDPRALKGFARDYFGMIEADLLVLVLPCGRSAHLEAGWAAGRGIPTIVILAEGEEAELMYNLLSEPISDLEDLIDLVDDMASTSVVCSPLRSLESTLHDDLVEFLSRGGSPAKLLAHIDEEHLWAALRHDVEVTLPAKGGHERTRPDPKTLERS
jgi:hypothetical protein